MHIAQILASLAGGGRAAEAAAELGRGRQGRHEAAAACPASPSSLPSPSLARPPEVVRHAFSSGRNYLGRPACTFPPSRTPGDPRLWVNPKHFVSPILLRIPKHSLGQWKPSCSGVWWRTSTLFCRRRGPKRWLCRLSPPNEIGKLGRQFWDNFFFRWSTAAVAAAAELPLLLPIGDAERVRGGPPPSRPVRPMPRGK